MDRALDLPNLRSAIGEHTKLPTPATVRELLAEAEIGIFTGGGVVDNRLLDSAWYLQAVATARPDLGLYELPRQRLAHQVSGHIFDLATQAAEMSEKERLRYTFAAQVGYLGGELAPNASALAARLGSYAPVAEWSEPGRISLEIGITVLALNRQRLYPLLRVRQSEMDDLSEGISGLSATRWEAAAEVVNGSWDLVNFLTYGVQENLSGAQAAFQRAIESESAAFDVDSRWVAAHLLRISGDLTTSSVWSVIPPHLPSAAKAMTLGEPPVLSLWPPQLSFLSGAGEVKSPLDPASRRLVLSFPTSAGKSLLAQLLIATHVAEFSTDVCVVAPTHSLCRELAQGLDRRLRTLGHQLHIESPLGLQDLPPPAARVTVMTPEKLSAHLRKDADAVLNKYGMFVIDEAHLVSDQGRGWQLEATLSFLHQRTIGSHHRILVLSAALGSQVHVKQWLEAGNEIVFHHEDWRGPRRLNAIYTSELDWDSQQIVPANGQKLERKVTPAHGVIHLSAGDSTFDRRFVTPVGKFVERRTKAGQWTKDLKASTTNRAKLVPLVIHVAKSGGVLVVEATRLEAQRMAADIAAELEDQPGSQVLHDLVKARLGDAHPLTKSLAKGVAFHHAALPIDIQSEIEDSVRAGLIRILVATTTLTEGVNLPFKTVIVGSRGYATPDGFEELIDAAGLVNAVGRAGRAGRESEGWMILAENQKFSEELFEPLNRTGAELQLLSNLRAEVALDGLSKFEQQARLDWDSAFSNYGDVADGFLSFVWFLAEDARNSPGLEQIMAVVKCTLAWQQLEASQRELITRAASLSLEVYLRAPASRRTRWARAGTSLPTARTIDGIVDLVFPRIVEAGSSMEPVELIDLLLRKGVLATLLVLPENTRPGFRPRRNAPRGEIVQVDVMRLLMDWLAGLEIQELADKHLASITDEGYRSEQLAEFSSSVFEHHLPRTCSLLVDWINFRLESEGHDNIRLPEDLPGYIHFGVSKVFALELMKGGIRSRRLANAVAGSVVALGLADRRERTDWLSSQSIEGWRHKFEASPTELADLLKFVRSPSAKLVSRLLEGKTLEFELTAIEPELARTAAVLLEEPAAQQPARIVAMIDDRAVAIVQTADHDEISLALNIGVPLAVMVSVVEGRARVWVTLDQVDGGDGLA